MSEARAWWRPLVTGRLVPGADGLGSQSPAPEGNISARFGVWALGGRSVYVIWWGIAWWLETQRDPADPVSRWTGFWPTTWARPMFRWWRAGPLEVRLWLPRPWAPGVAAARPS